MATPYGGGALTVANEASARPSQAKNAKVYQIDFTAVASGKRIASTKRRVRWRFGFANPEALASGKTGTDCRGEEHDITLVWSITSGKRLVLADGQEVHYSSSRGGIFDFSWTMRGNHVLKIVAHASPPLSAAPGFRQYDFFVDGQSFFTFPKVFRLGLAPGDPRGVASPTNSYSQRGGAYNNYSLPATSTRSAGSANIASLEAPRTADEEEAYLREAIKISLEDSTPRPSSSSVAPTSSPTKSGEPDLLLGFFDDAASAPPTVASAPTVPYQAPAPSPWGAPQPQQAAAPLALPSSSAPAYGAAPPQFGAPTQPGGFAAPPPPAPAYGAPPQPGAPLALPASTTPVAPLAFAAPPSQPSPAVGAPPPAQPTPAPFPPHAQQAPPPAATPFDTFGAAPPQQQPAPPPAAPFNTFGAPPQAQPPAPTATPFDTFGAPQAAASPPAGQYAQPGPPPAPVAVPLNTAPPTPGVAPVPEFASPAPQPTPSSLGFASPQAQAMNGFATPGVAPTPAVETPAFAPQPESEVAVAPSDPAITQPAPVDPAALTMEKLSGQETLVSDQPDPNASLADQAYMKFKNMATFDLTAKSEPKRDNPFEVSSSTMGGNQSLADIKSMFASKSEPKKDIMKSPTPAPGALVVSTSQQGNWGGQYGVSPMAPAGGLASPAYGQPAQPPAFGAAPPAPPNQPAYGAPPPAPPTYGAPPGAPPAYGAPPAAPQAYGAPPAAPPAYGAPAGFQQPPAQPQYGAPPVGQAPYGQQPMQSPPPVQQPYGQFGQQQLQQPPAQYGGYQQGY